MYLSTPLNGTVYVQAWAYSSNFFGHFELKGPNKLDKNGNDQTWYTGKRNFYQWSNIPAVVGQYCVIGWTKNGNGTYTKNGQPCESVL